MRASVIIELQAYQGRQGQHGLDGEKATTVNRKLSLLVASRVVTNSWDSLLLVMLMTTKVEVAAEAAEEAEAAEVVVVPLRPKPKRLVGAVMPRRL